MVTHSLFSSVPNKHIVAGPAYADQYQKCAGNVNYLAIGDFSPDFQLIECNKKAVVAKYVDTLWSKYQVKSSEI